MPDGVGARCPEVVRERRGPPDGEDVALARDLRSHAGRRVADDRRRARSALARRIRAGRPRRRLLRNRGLRLRGGRVGTRLLPRLAGRGRWRSGHLSGGLRIADENLGAGRKPSVLLRQRHVDARYEAAISAASLVLADERLLEDDRIAPVSQIHSLIREAGDRLAEDDKASDPGAAQVAPGVLAGYERAGGEVDGACGDLAAEELDGAETRRGRRPRGGSRPCLRGRRYRAD